MSQEIKSTEQYYYVPNSDGPYASDMQGHHTLEINSPSLFSQAQSKQHTMPEPADSINSHPSITATKDSRNAGPEVTDCKPTDGSESINSHVSVVNADGQGKEKKSEGRISYAPRYQGYWQVLALILVTLAIAITHMLLSFLRLIDNQLDGLHGYLDRIIIYQFCMPVISILPLFYLALKEADTDLLLRLNPFPRLTARIPSHLVSAAITTTLAIMILVGTAMEQKAFDWRNICRTRAKSQADCDTKFTNRVRGISRAATVCTWLLFFFWLVLAIISFWRVRRARQGKDQRPGKGRPERSDFPCPSCESWIHFDFRMGAAKVVGAQDQV